MNLLVYSPTLRPDVFLYFQQHDYDGTRRTYYCPHHNTVFAIAYLLGTGPAGNQWRCIRWANCQCIEVAGNDLRGSERLCIFSPQKRSPAVTERRILFMEEMWKLSYVRDHKPCHQQSPQSGRGVLVLLPFEMSTVSMRRSGASRASVSFA